MPRPRLVVALALAIGLAAAACTDDNPQTDLPCAFYLEQLETEAIDIEDVPDELRDEVRDRCPTETGPTEDDASRAPTEPDGPGS